MKLREGRSAVRKSLSLILVFVLLFSVSLSFYPPGAASDSVTIKVEPSIYQTSLPDGTFKVNVTISGLLTDWRAVGVQFRLCYNETLLEVVNVDEGPFMLDPRWNLYGTFWYWDDRPGDMFYGTHVIVGILIYPNETGVWEAFPSGDGVLATITFRTIYQPTPGECALELVDTMVIDDGLQEIPVTLEHGLYQWLPPPPPIIKLEPPLFQAQLLNKTFQVNVTINSLWDVWKAVGLQFRLCYNETLLEVVDVTQGPFLLDPRWNLYGTFWYWDDRPGDMLYGTHVIVGILIYPNETGVWEAFPSGDGVLATITFRTIYQERGLEKPPLTCELELVDTMVIDDDLEEIPITLQHGAYEMYPTHISDINYDGKVDIKDVAMVSKAFGTMPDYGPWNPVCDINGDEKVDIKDVAIVSKGFGWTRTYDP